MRVTYLPRAGVSRPTVVEGCRVLDADSPVVWFTFPGAWHDVGRFHTPDGALTGCYANVLTPVRIERGEPDRWWTTDLYLDVFRWPDGAAQLLDQDELDEAVREGWLEGELASRAGEEARRLLTAAREGRWPPPIVEEWTLERARAVAG